MPSSDHQNLPPNFSYELPVFNLSNALDGYLADTLKHIVKWLAISNPVPTRKADMIAAIADRLDDATLREFYGKLDKLQRSAIQEALYSESGCYKRNQFLAKYGQTPSGCEYVSAKNISLPFRLFLYQDEHAWRSLDVPVDLANRMREFVPQPQKLQLSSTEELPESVERPLKRFYWQDEEKSFVEVELRPRTMEYAAIQDLSSVLRLVDLGKVSVGAQTGHPSKTSVRRIAESLSGGDFYDHDESKNDEGKTIGPIRAFAWPLLLQSAKLAERRGSKLTLTKSGLAALGSPAAETLQKLWKQWIKQTEHDEFRRINVIKGQQRGKGRRTMTAASSRRQVVVDALSRCPIGRWVRFDDFSNFMIANNHTFEVTRNAWHLYIADPEHGSLGYDGCGGWDVLQVRYMLCLLFEYVATLGLIDIAYTHPKNARMQSSQWGTDDLYFLSRYDGLQYIRLNSLGAFCLGFESSYEPTSVANQTGLAIYPDLRLHAEVSPQADELLLIETFATREAENTWRLARDKTLSAIENGQDIDSLRAFLTVRDDQPLPETVEGFLRSMERAGHALTRIGTAVLIECVEEEIANNLATDRITAKLCSRSGKTHLVVQSNKEAAFRKAVRQLGYPLPRI